MVRRPMSAVTHTLRESSGEHVPISHRTVADHGENLSIAGVLSSSLGIMSGQLRKC